jgi:hypothetical protein
MSSPEYAHSGYKLPTVSIDTVESLFGDAVDQGVNPIMKKAEELLEKNNRDLYLAIGQFVLGSNLEDKEAVAIAHKVMIITYELLRRQAEADSMNTAFLSTDPSAPES